MFIRSAVVLSVLAAASANEWTLNTDTSVSTLVGVGAGSDTVAVAAAGASGVGALVEKLADGKWTKGQVGTGMILDAATTADGHIVVSSVWGVYTSTDGKTFTAASGINGASQSANVMSNGNFALVGNWVVPSPDGTKPGSVSGVAVSKDNGATWSLSTAVPPEWARYGAFPTDNTWYVSSGMWGSAAEDKKLGGHRLSSRVHLDKVKGFSYPEVAKNGTVGATGWFGAVSKTTDGGATWKEVFHTNIENDYLYFNGISCASENHCVVAAEGYTAEGDYMTQAYTTFDGVTWTPTLTTSDVGMMQVDFLNENEAWIGGTKKDGRNLYGQFYKTTDGGKTWNLEQSLNNCYAIDMDMATTTGFAACSSSSGSSCSVAVYA